MQLALTRVAVFTACLLLAVNGEFLYFSTLPRELVFPPRGAAWMAPLLPRSPGEAQAILGIYVVTVTAAILGWRTRISTVLAAVGSVYVLGVPQFFGFVKHYHNVVWFAAILSASPCGDALSLDRWLGRRSEDRPAGSYQVPLLFIAWITGSLYFGAGFWKAYSGGASWIEADSFRHQLFEKWTELEWTPEWRIDREPLLCEFFAAATIAIELSFLPFVAFRPTRWLAVVGGLGFHLGAYLFMGIGFWYLAICYVAFIPWPGPRESPVRAWFRQPSAVVGMALLIGVWLANVKQIHSWPIASYPTFAHIFRQPVKSNIVLQAVKADGQRITRNLESPRLLAKMGSDRHLSLLRAILHDPPSARRDQRLRIVLCQGVKEGALPEGLREIRFDQYVRSTIPEDWGNQPLRVFPIPFRATERLVCPPGEIPTFLQRLNRPNHLR